MPMLHSPAVGNSGQYRRFVTFGAGLAQGSCNHFGRDSFVERFHAGSSMRAGHGSSEGGGNELLGSSREYMRGGENV